MTLGATDDLVVLAIQPITVDVAAEPRLLRVLVRLVVLLPALVNAMPALLGLARRAWTRRLLRGSRLQLLDDLRVRLLAVAAFCVFLCAFLPLGGLRHAFLASGIDRSW